MVRTRSPRYSILYVIAHAAASLHKIGITNNWERRKQELGVGAVTRAVHVVRVTDARKLEAFLHRRFSNSRLPQSEWFQLSDDDLIFLRSAILKAKDDYRRSHDRGLSDDCRTGSGGEFPYVGKSGALAGEKDRRSQAPQVLDPHRRESDGPAKAMGLSPLGPASETVSPASARRGAGSSANQQQVRVGSRGGYNLKDVIVMFWLYSAAGMGIAQIAGNIGLAPSLVVRPDACLTRPQDKACSETRLISPQGGEAALVIAVVSTVVTLARAKRN